MKPILYRSFAYTAGIWAVAFISFGILLMPGDAASEGATEGPVRHASGWTLAILSLPGMLFHGLLWETPERFISVWVYPLYPMLIPNAALYGLGLGIIHTKFRDLRFGT